MESLEEIEMYKTEPPGFTSQAKIAAIYVEVGGEVLFLQKADSEKGLWGVPAGKLEKGESAQAAAKRELLEETGISITPHSRFISLGRLYFRKVGGDYVYHIYGLFPSKKPSIQLSKEHEDSSWLDIGQAQKAPLMLGALEALEHYKIVSQNKARNGTNVNAYLILKKGEQILLHLRKNTGYYDGYYGLVSGHVEDGESAQAGLIREAKEEARISINIEDLHFSHCLHRQTNRLNIDLFFVCDRWKGELKNMEIEKCAALEFFPINDLPPNMVGYVADVLEHSRNENYYSEEGWND